MESLSLTFEHVVATYIVFFLIASVQVCETENCEPI